MKKSSVRVLEVVALVLTLSLGADLLWQEYSKRSHQRCRENMRALAQAMEVYSTDSVGRYPHQLSALCPRYLSGLPSCPTGGSYEAEVTSSPDVFTITCNGAHPEKMHYCSVHWHVCPD